MPQTLDTAAAKLVARFRRQRPLRGGSLIVTLFGDSIMPRGGALALGSLIQLAAPFGLNERLIRTATARLAQDGWLESRRSGNRSEYRISAGGRVRFAEATMRIYDPPADWSGRWTLVVLPTMRASERRRLRDELIWNGFGEISAGVFAHPEAHFNIESKTGTVLSNSLIFNAVLSDENAAMRLVSAGWDLAELGRRYRDFGVRFGPVRVALRARRAPDPQTCFIVRTLLIHDYRRLHLRDPLLPPRLLHAEWPGARAAELCREVYGRVFSASEQYLSSVAAPLDGALPQPDPSVLRRFGGLDLD